MNFIISILMFAFLSAASFLVSTHTTPNSYWNNFYIGCSVVNGLVSVIILVVMVFRQMEFQKEARELLNQIRQNKYIIKQKKNNLIRYKEELKDILTKNYPDYEKDIFKDMNHSDSENLSTILVKYPELKFNGVLKDYTDGIKCQLNDISSYEHSIISDRRALEDISMSGWKLVGSKISLDVTIDESDNA